MAVTTYSLSRSGSNYLSKNFQVKEFKCNDGSDTILIDSQLIDTLQKIRDHFGKSVHINSAYRTVSYNKKIGGSGSSQHCKGTAADIWITGVDPMAIALYAASLPYFASHGGIGLYSRPASTISGFCHVDTRTGVSRWISKTGTSYLSVSKIMPTLKVGSKDGTGNAYAVTVLQRHLSISTDGSFGAKTASALKTWQGKHKLTADGICGPATWTELSK